ncbi:aromatic ring-hydroxylating dioxygenase subunit alpha [Burkholderia pyrrocinia]|uniref:aromatic ring-hydroxylating oxygenase subunit alpha n=1 Tax=Burkholderia pyrrocinia TaxID=60550 RepID=UPI002AB20A30|nr:aromatic ring-hydroxylating dioxygenase subunit alpha [Burkholderia pyrrocinia]
MLKHEQAELVGMIKRQRPGWSLEQSFYVDPSVYAAEQELWFPRQWTLVGHVSELPRKGSYIVRQLFGEDIVIVRSGDADGEMQAYFNVCTHRGSRLCARDGHARLLVCPYHAWSFKLTGELQTRRDLPSDVDPDSLGLRRVALRVVSGVILCGLDADHLPDPQPAIDSLGEALRTHGVDRARIAKKITYPTQANWKLVLENFLECYHCRPAHPEYCSANGHVKVTAVRDAAMAEQWARELSEWQSDTARVNINQPVWVPGGIDEMPYGVNRKPIGDGRKTLSQDGEPVSRLMGDFSAYDGGETVLRFGRLSFASATNDYVILVQIVPRNSHETDVTLTWLVDRDAEQSINTDALCWMWDITTQQDKRITEDNAIGVRSMAYRPGPYTPLESQTEAFVSSYLAEMETLITGVVHAPLKIWAEPFSNCMDAK